MYFHEPEARTFKEITPGVRIRTFWGEKLLLSVVNLDSNAVIPAHHHPQEQSVYVLEGELEFYIAGETRLVSPGDLIIIPENVEHSVIVGPNPAKVLDSFSPVREDLKY